MVLNILLASILFDLLLVLFFLPPRFLRLPLRHRFDDGRHRTAFHGGESRWLRWLLLRGRRRPKQRRFRGRRTRRRGRPLETESGGRGTRGDERELRGVGQGVRGRHWRHRRRGREELLLLLLMMEQRGEGRLEAGVQGEAGGRGHGRVVQGRVDQRAEKMKEGISQSKKGYL